MLCPQLSAMLHILRHFVHVSLNLKIMHIKLGNNPYMYLINKNNCWDLTTMKEGNVYHMQLFKPRARNETPIKMQVQIPLIH